MTGHRAARHRLLISAIVVIGAASACAAPSATPEPPVVAIVGHDFALEAPDSLPPGPTRFTFRSDGTVPHEVGIGRVKRGVPLDSVLKMELTGADITPLYDPGAGLLYTGVGDTVDAELLVTLERGRDYVLICTLDEKGKPHSMLGMLHGLRVTAK